MIHQGDVIDDRFEVLELLGEGGLAQVWKVRHRELGSVHALKLLMFRKVRLAERLILEGRIQAQLRHPNVVKVTDVVRHRGQVGLLMEYVEGANLEHLMLKVGAMELDRALSLAAAIISGVVAAHDQGVLHRDLKPANILLSREPRGLVPKVTDFGIAKVVAGAEDFTETRVGAVMGTPGYLAPEQATDASTVDARADVFALGALVYELLAGRRAFEGADLAEALDAELVPLSEVGRDDVPEPVARAIGQALSKDPDARYPSCRAFAQALFVERPDLLEVSTSSHGGAPLSLSAALGPVTPTGETSRGGAPTLAPDHEAAAPVVAPAGSAASAPPARPTDDGGSSRMRWLALAALLLGALGAFVLRTAGVGDRPGGSAGATPPDDATAAQVTPAPGEAPVELQPSDDAVPSAAGGGSGPDETVGAADEAGAAPGAGDVAAPEEGSADAPPADPVVEDEPSPDREGTVAPSPSAAETSPSEPPEPEPDRVAAPTPAAEAPPETSGDAPDDAEPPPSEAEPLVDAEAPADGSAPSDGEVAETDPEDGVAVVEPLPEDAGEVSSEPDPPAAPAPPPEPEAPELLGLWRGTAGGRPMRLRITGQDGVSMNAEVVFLLGPTERRHALRGTWEPGGTVTFVESGGGLSLSGRLDGTSMQGTYTANGGGRSQGWSASWSSR